MTTTIKVELAAQSKAVVPKVQIVSDDLEEKEIVKRVTALFDTMEGLAMSFARKRV